MKAKPPCLTCSSWSMIKELNEKTKVVTATDRGECRKRSPQVVVVNKPSWTGPQETEVKSLWPVTRASAWCDDHTPVAHETSPTPETRGESSDG